MFADCKYSPCASTLLRNYNILSAFRIQFIDKGDFYKLKFCHSDIYMYICIVKQE
jgi:hypothetical protein